VRRILCPFELHGVCNDEQCAYQHERDYLLSHHNAYEELCRYHLPESSNNQTEEVDPLAYEDLANQWLHEVQSSVVDSPADILFLRDKAVSVKGKEYVRVKKQLQAWEQFTQTLSYLRKQEYEMGLRYLDAVRVRIHIFYFIELIFDCFFPCILFLGRSSA
jgi:hypothetical protein